MNKALLSLIYYIIGLIAVFASHQISPTNLAGPGLDMIVYPLVFVVGWIQLLRHLIKLISDKHIWPFFMAYLIGTTAMMIVLFIPANSW